MEKSKIIRLVILLLIILGVLIIFILYNSWPLLNGKRIVLDTMTYDPFDPLRGQYMQIRYEISQLNGTGFNEGDKVCVLLEEDAEGIYRPKEVSKKPFNQGTFICGKVKSNYGKTIRAEYDIERFYFEKGAKVPTQNVTVEIYVSSSGRARLSRLFQNNKPIEIDYRPLTWQS